jgi:hypothetical protein
MSATTNIPSVNQRHLGPVPVAQSVAAGQYDGMERYQKVEKIGEGTCIERGIVNSIRCMDIQYHEYAMLCNGIDSDH